MSTHKNIKRKRNKTHKNKTNAPSIKVLHKGYKLYGAKNYNPKDMFEYEEKRKKQYHNDCIKDSFSWFGSYNVAYQYSLNDTSATIYKFKTRDTISLVNINKKNKNYFQKLFTNTDKKLKPIIHIKKDQLKNISYDHKYLNMSLKEQAYYEFCFCFGYMTLNEQYHFLELIRYLIKEKMVDITKRDGGSILEKINLRLGYYKINHIFDDSTDSTDSKDSSMFSSPIYNNMGVYKVKVNNPMYNRMSIYSLDVNSISNLCSILPKYIDGVYYGNNFSYWYPRIINNFNLEEYIIFNPPKTLNIGEDI